MRLSLLYCLLGICSFSFAEEIRPFESDGCSMFPDGTFEEQNLWLECCIEHDYQYWKGGTYEQRKKADNDLKLCVANVGQTKTAELMLAGVRVGGSPYLPTRFRWGYGWPWPRGYSELNAVEQELIDENSRPLEEILAPDLFANDQASIRFYNSYGYQTADGWTIPIKTWAYEKPDTVRLFVARAARNILKNKAGIDKLSPKQIEVFDERVHGFIADSESKEQIEFSFNNDQSQNLFSLVANDKRATTDRNGNLNGEIVISNEYAVEIMNAQKSENGELRFTARDSLQEGIGNLRLLSDVGLSVISDIDDTIKITEIPAGEERILKNTFFSTFREAPCMATLYQTFPDSVSFHYVSGGPWQLYRPIVDFMFGDANTFPLGSLHMKNVRTNPTEVDSYKDIWKLIGGAGESATVTQKLSQIKTILTHFPKRRFILIGDSGEHDPEIFTKIRDDHPDQIQAIFIRDVINAAELSPERLTNMVTIPPDFQDSNTCQDWSETLILKEAGLQ